MKLLNRKTQPILAVLLAVCLVFGTMTVPGVFAQEKADEGVAPSSVEPADSGATDDAGAVVRESGLPNASVLSSSDAKDVAPIDQGVSAFSSNSEASGVDVQAENAAYSIQVTFDGKDLSANESDNTATSWNSDTTKSARVTLNKNASAIEEGARYVLRMKTSQLFYFTGMPDESKVTGINNVAMVQNEAPQVKLNTRNTASLETFSPYSGEIRVELNTVSETVSLTDIGVRFNTELVGYSDGQQTLANPVSFEVAKCTDQGELQSLQESDFETVADTSRSVHSAEVTTGSFSNGGMKTTLSIDEFETSGINMQNVVLGKGGSISYAGGTAGEANQVYKTLTAVFNCPYVEVDGSRYYLSIDETSAVLSTNMLGAMKCFNMKSEAVYDASAHTITYRFEDIYLGGHTPFFVTPAFTFPEDLKGKVVPKGGYKIQGGDWKITEQKCWSGANASLKTSYSSPYFGTFLPDGADVKMTSSAESDSSQGIAKRQICNLLTRSNGNAGTLGFFDVHNDGTDDSDELDIKFEFNTGASDDAQYYVTSVNLPTADSVREVSFTLMDQNGNKKAGAITIDGSKDSQRRGVCISCTASALRAAVGADDTYYIKSVAYKTKLVAGKAYHIETAHLNRNRTNDGGLFFGFIEGDVGKTASATMTISAPDGTSSINRAGQTSVSSTEKSTISTDDYIGFGLREMYLNKNQNTIRLTAGEGASLSFGANVSTEEYRKSANELVVNGYHLFRDGVFYVALPDGVSIAGKDQAKVTVTGNRTVPAQTVEKLEGSDFTEDGVSASWWKVTIPGINAWGTYFTVSIDLSTNLAMQGVQWNFKNHILVQSGNQEASWSAASSWGNTYKTTQEVRNGAKNNGGVTALMNLLDQQNGNKELVAGLGLYNANSQATMTIARAEAKLDVETFLRVGSSTTSEDASLYAAADDIDYSVTVSSTDGGEAKDFAYYVPIVSTASAIDASAWTMKNEFGLKLKRAVDIARASDTQANDGLPFSVFYTTEQNLTSETVKSDNVTWESYDAIGDSAVTAVKIVTNDNAVINNNESFRFDFDLGFDEDSGAFDKLAGSQVQWRTFGRYTYERNGATTTNTYPSGDNAITIKFRKDLTEEASATNLVLDTGGTTNKANVEKQSIATFSKRQALRVKSVAPSSGTQLVLDNDDTVSAYTGSDANAKFSVRFNINNDAVAAVNLGGKTPMGSWTLEPNTAVTLMAEAVFSKALTDTATVRYVDIVVGNDDIDITWRVNLVRKVAPATLEGAGLAAGEKFQSFTPEKDVVVSQNSALSSQFKVDGFISGNYADQKISLLDGSGAPVSFPQGTSITLMQLDDRGNALSYWWHQVTGSESSVSLKSFKRMAGADSYALDTSSSSSTTLRYLFVVDFADDSALLGDYQLLFAAEQKTGVAGAAVSSRLPFAIAAKSSFMLSSTAQSDSDDASCNVAYTVTKSTGSESALDHRSLALVLKPQAGSVLPVDAVVVAGGKTYARGIDGSFVVPLGEVSTGEVSLSLKSALLPLSGKAYAFDGQMYLSQSSDAAAPMNGAEVGNLQSVTFTKASTSKPSIRVTGARVATAAQWASGQDISLRVSGVPSDGSVVVTALSGLDGTQKVTDLLSSVAGAFTIQNGAGTLDASKVQDGAFSVADGKLVLNGSTAPGTYRLQFDIKDATGTTLQNESYVIVVR